MTGQQARKHAWAVRHDGLAFGSGRNEIGATKAADDQITASEVKDRNTLKAFVEDVLVYQENITTVTGIARLRDFFRSEGRYRSGSVFLMTMTRNGTILVHGHDPTTENKNIAVVKDELGKPVRMELLAAAEQGSGFVEYVFDNPAVEGDEETGSQKIAYATGIPVPGRDQVFVVASGFFPDE